MRAPKGTPTRVNVYAMAQHFAGADRATNRVDAVSAPHLRRCIAAGLVRVEGRELVLTEAGQAARAVAVERERVTIAKHNAAVAAERVSAARSAEAKLAAIARTRRPTDAETAEARRAYQAAAELPANDNGGGQ